MRKASRGGILAIALMALTAFTTTTAHHTGHTATQAADPIQWMTWTEAIAAMEKQPKKIFVDVYTDWCGWCKKMDKSTFRDPRVAKYIGEHFYAVKLNAEQREDIRYKETSLKYVNSENGRGVHQLAYALLDGRLGYPAFVYLDEQQHRITISPGFKEADALLKELRYIAEDLFRSQTYDQYLETAGSRDRR